MKIENKKATELSVKCGKTTDSIEVLTNKCKMEAQKLLNIIEFPVDCTANVSFWTSDFPELICVGHFYNEDGVIQYDLDFSESTL